MSRIIEFQGRRIEVPDGTTDEQLAELLGVSTSASSQDSYPEPAQVRNSVAPSMRSQVDIANEYNRGVSAELERLKQINPQALDDPDRLANLAAFNYAQSLQPKAPQPDREQQYVARGYEEGSTTPQSAGKNAAFDARRQALNNAAFQKAPPDERGDRVSLPYNPNTESERVAAELKQLEDLREAARGKQIAEEMNPVVRGITKGMVQSAGLTAATVGYIGDVFGNDAAKKWGLEVNDETSKIANALTLSKSASDISSVDEFSGWLAENAGYVAYQAAEAILTGGAGAALGKQVGKKVAVEAVALGMNNLRQTLGSVYADAVEESKKTGEPVSLLQVAAGAVASAAVDTFADKFGLDSMGANGFKGNVLSRMTKSIGSQMAVQGGTEALQLIPEEIGANRDPFREGMGSQFFDEAAVGALGGGGPGIAGGIQKYQAAPAPTASDIAREKGFLVPETRPAQRTEGPPIRPTAPLVEDQPTVPTAPEVTTPPPASGLAAILQREGLIRNDAENGTSNRVPPVPAAVVPERSADPTASVGPGLDTLGGDGADSRANAPGAVDQPGQLTSVPVNGAVIPTATDPRSALAAELAALRERAAQPAPAATNQPVSTWTGRKGGGYETREQAEAQLPARQRAEPTLVWTAEELPNGRFQLAGREPTLPADSNFAQAAAQQNQPRSEVPRANPVTAIVGKTSETAQKHSDLRDATTYPAPILERIAAAPDASPELVGAVRQEQQRRADAEVKQTAAAERSRAEDLSGQSAEISPNVRDGARPLSVERGMEILKDSRERALMPQEKGYLDALKSEIGEPAFNLVQRQAQTPYRVSMSERKFDLPRIIEANNAAIAAWDKGPEPTAAVPPTSSPTPTRQEVSPDRFKPAGSVTPTVQALPTGAPQAQNTANGTDTTATSPGVGGTAPSGTGLQGAQRYPDVLQATTGGQQNTATTTTGRSGPPPSPARLAAPAPTAPIAKITEARQSMLTHRKVDTEPVATKELNPEQNFARQLANYYGRTVTFLRRVSGAKNDMPDGFVLKEGDKDVFIDADSNDGALFVTAHEIDHSLPEDLRTRMQEGIARMATPEAAGEVLRQGYKAEDVQRELPAFIVQALTKRKDYWTALRDAVGDKDFAEFTKVILTKLDELVGALRGRQTPENEFLRTALGSETKIKEARDFVAGIHSEAIKRANSNPQPASPVSGSPVLAKKPITVGEFETIQNKDGSMTVLGSPEQIRALIPEGVTGRVTKEGIAFTHSDAPRVKHALEGNKTAYSRAGVVTEKLALDNEGKYLGAPEKFNSPGKIPHLRKWLMKLTKEGEAGRYWYENSSKAVLRMVGGDVQEARKFVALLAIYSPQAKVDTNSTFALRAWSQYKAGKPISVKTGVMDKKAQKALDDVDEFWSGEKTGNFFTNLLSEIDPATRGKQGATIDMWMMRAAQYDSDAPTKTQYAFMENETNRIAAELGWEPQQVQAAIWVAMKARMENDGVKKATEAKSEKKGWIHYAYPLKNGKPQKTRVVDKPQEHRDNWLAHAIAHDPSKTDTQRAKFDFEDGLRRHIGQVSWEARPGRSTGVLPGVNDAPYDQQVEFQQAVQRALQGPNGEDLLAQQLGLLMDGEDVLAPGVWQGEVAAGMQKQIAMAPAKGSEFGLDATQKKNLDIYSAVLGLLLRQEGVGWHRPFYNGNKSGENGVEIRIGQPFTPEQAKELWTALDSRMRDKGVAEWEQGAGMISSPEGMRVVNFGALEDNKAFKALVADAVGDLTIPDPHLKDFTSDGNLVTNDWKEGPNGEGFISHIRDSGRSDLLGWSRDVLAPRVQRVFDEFSEKYDWGNPGSIAFSNKAEADNTTQQEVSSERNLDQDIILEIPLEEGGTAKLTINAQRYIKQLDAREEALRMVKECLA